MSGVSGDDDLDDPDRVERHRHAAETHDEAASRHEAAQSLGRPAFVGPALELADARSLRGEGRVDSSGITFITMRFTLGVLRQYCSNASSTSSTPGVKETNL